MRKIFDVAIAFMIISFSIWCAFFLAGVFATTVFNWIFF